MKKIYVLMLVVLVLAVAVVPVSAKNGQAQVRGPFALSGTVTGVDLSAGTVTVTAVCGNTVVKPYIGQSVTLQTSAATRFLLNSADGTATLIKLSDLAVGQNVSAWGQVSNGVWSANRITVGARLDCVS